MSTRTDIATTRFLSGYNCAQAVLDAFRDEASLDEDLALKMATGLGAGMGRKQEVCGAVTGGVLVLGLRHGRGSAPLRDFLRSIRAYPDT
jgi:C_GCAxxG_C_C family probable redox protein